MELQPYMLEGRRDLITKADFAADIAGELRRLADEVEAHPFDYVGSDESPMV